MKTIPNYHPPSDYRRPTKTQEKVYVPVNDYPEINFSMLANPLTFLTLLHISCLGVYERHDYDFSHSAVPHRAVMSKSNPFIALQTLNCIQKLTRSFSPH